MMKDLKFYNLKKKELYQQEIFINKKSKGTRFITFLDADDLWHKDFLKNRYFSEINLITLYLLLILLV